ncbi:glycosyltransferase family 2 protein [Leuconostoc fallax]|uniref:glycosyltransferase family 2 protein n=1 Tax=Leuconostoc fallax TaxID=1251 RepID=UPI0020912469|nr:glycosyltransferase family 2 protein [Leuconostoc fallax]MCO6183162.1 glycosyltransferase [Leuconostoc fallax]
MISVLMCVYNESESILSQSITSIKEQSNSEWELIIVNDNPDDKNLSKFLMQIKKNDPRINIFTNEHNYGLVTSLNIAFSKAQGEYIARMDADDVANNKRLEKQIEFLEKNNLDFIFSNVQSIDESGEIHKEKVLPATDLIDSDKIKDIMSFTDIAFHPTWFMKKPVMTELNGYRSINSAEDYDFVIRAIRAGLHLGYQGEVLLQYRYRLGSISRNNTLRQEKINTILQKGLTEDESWNDWSIKQVNDLKIREQEEKKLNRILQSGVQFKNSKKISSGCELFVRMLLYPKGIKPVFRKITVDKRIREIFYK